MRRSTYSLLIGLFLAQTLLVPAAAQDVMHPASEPVTSLMTSDACCWSAAISTNIGSTLDIPSITSWETELDPNEVIVPLALIALSDSSQSLMSPPSPQSCRARMPHPASFSRESNARTA